MNLNRTEVKIEARIKEPEAIPLYIKASKNYRPFNPTLDSGREFPIVVFVPNDTLKETMEEKIDYYLVTKALFLSPNRYIEGKFLKNDGTYIAYVVKDGNTSILPDSKDHRIRKNPDKPEKFWIINDGECYVYDPPPKTRDISLGEKTEPRTGISQVQNFPCQAANAIMEFFDSKKERKRAKIRRMIRFLETIKPISIGRSTINYLNKRDTPDIILSVLEIQEAVESIVGVQIRKRKPQLETSE